MGVSQVGSDFVHKREVRHFPKKYTFVVREAPIQAKLSVDPDVLKQLAAELGQVAAEETVARFFLDPMRHGRSYSWVPSSRKVKESAMPTRQQRIEGGLVGLLVGDALGVPYEFSRPEDLPTSDEIEFNPPAGLRRAHAGTPPGTWSDDGAQALCLLASLLERGRLDPDDLGKRLLDWYSDGYMAVDGRVFDVGITTAQALSAMRSGTPAIQAGSTGESANGNGSLMRVLPLALWHQGPDGGLILDAQAQSRVTHGHLRSQLCCALYCLWACRILEEHPLPYQNAVETLSQFYADVPHALEELEQHIRPLADPDNPGSGYVVDCLRSARIVVDAGGYETVVKRAVLMGHDTDTTACVAGGIAGLRDGIDAIPARWRSFLRGGALYRPLLEELLERRRGDG
jgi:ADP-ribosylglycohydrolase